MALHEALKAWRKDETRRRYGTARLRLIGPSLVMTDEVAGRITDFCSKIKTVENLRREVPEWKDLARYASQILTLIAEYSPLPPPVAAPDAQAEQSPGLHAEDEHTELAAIGGGATRVYHCGRCGEAGHNSAHYLHYSLGTY